MTDVTVDTRGVSTAVGYVITLSVTALLISGLLAAGGTVVTDNREDVAREELSVVGQQLAADIETADRLVQRSPSSATVEIDRRLPEKVVGSTYTVSVVTTGSNAVLELSTTDPEVTVTIDVDTEVGLAGSSVDGGKVLIVYTGASPGLEVRDV